MKVVDRHYLIRSYQAVMPSCVFLEIVGAAEEALMRMHMNRDGTTHVMAYLDVFTSVSGSQGLGILPDLLDLEHNARIKARERYMTALRTLERHKTTDADVSAS